MTSAARWKLFFRFSRKGWLLLVEYSLADERGDHHKILP